MTSKLLLFSIISSLLVIIFILRILKKGRINIKYAIIWLVAFCSLFLLLIIPNLLQYITNLLGFSLSSNMIIVFFILILVTINLSLTIIISGQTEKIKLLIQEVSILKKEVEKNADKDK